MAGEFTRIAPPLIEIMNRLDAEAFADRCHPEVSIESRITSSDQAIYEGREGVRRLFANLGEAFEWIHIEGTVVADAEDRGVLEIRFRARGRISGAEVEQCFFQGTRMRDGKLAWWRFFETVDEAKEALGLY